MPMRRAGVAILLSVCGITWTLHAGAQPFSSPVGCDDCISWWYYLDHGNNTDYDCESSTYDNHNGTDYSLRGGNSSIDDDNEVLAAAAGIVRTVSDGNYDRCTECGGSGCGTNTPGGGFSNYVVVDHGDYDTTYGHMQSGSITVQEGDSVDCGTVIGHIGSAGCSTGAHLHFQPRPRGGSYRNNPLDPHEGACSPTTASLWGEQGPHRGLPGHTCDDQPSTPVCPADTYEIWTCAEDGASRRRCVDGVDSTEECAFGCDAMPSGTDDVCALPPDNDGDGVRADTDCDDSRADIHPGALETCGDDIDQDCSGGDATCDTGDTDAGVSTTDGTVSVGGAAASGAGGVVSNANATSATTAGEGTGVGGSSGISPPSSVGPTATSAPANTGTTAAQSTGSVTPTSSTATVGDVNGGVGSADGTVGGTPSIAPQPVESGCACRAAPAHFDARRELALLGLIGVALGRRRRPRSG